MQTTRSFDKWATAVVRELVALGVDMLEANHIPYENEEWFRGAFDAGESASLMASEWVNNF